MTYSLWIPVRNEESNIKGVIESVLDQQNPPKNIYVCVNGSTDKSTKIVHDMAKSVSNLVHLESRPGKANAWNEIIKNSHHDVMVFCDGDIRFGSTDTLSRLTRDLSISNNLLLGASVIQLPSKRTTPYKFRAPSGQLYAMKRVLLDTLEPYWWKMPEAMINEDLFLTLMAYPYVNVTDSAFFYCNKPSIPDIFHTQVRILRWIRQIMDMGLSHEFNELISSSFREEDDWKKRLKYRLIPYLARFVKATEGDNLWREALSTKNRL